MATSRLILGNPNEDENPYYQSSTEARRGLSGSQPEQFTSLGKVNLDSLLSSSGGAYEPSSSGSMSATTQADPGYKKLGKMNLDSLFGEEPKKVEPPKKVAEEQGDFFRRAGIALEQSPAMLKGAVGIVGDTGERVFGKDGMFTALKNYGFEGFKKDMAQIETKSKDIDDLTVAWARAKEGDLGAMVDWAQGGLGYVAGNVIETGLMTLAGGLIGTVAGGGPVGTIAGATTGAVAKGAAKGFIKDMVEAAVQKEAKRVIAENAAKAGAKELSEDAVTKIAVRNVAGNIGQVGAVVGGNIAKEVGGVYGEGRQQAESEGRELDAGDLARMWVSGIAAGTVEGVVDRLGVKALTGKLPIPGKGTLGRAIVGGATGAGIEGGTELIQTVMERYGAGKGLTDEDAINDYINSFALGALGGGTLGSISSLRGKKDTAPGLKEKFLKDAEAEMTSDDGRRDLFESMMQDEKMRGVLQANGIENSDDPRFQSVIIKAINTERLLDSVNVPTADEQAKTTKQRGEDVQAAFGDTASTSVGVGTGTGDPVIQRSSVVPNTETRTLEPVGANPQPATLPDGKTQALSGEDMVSAQSGYTVESAFNVGDKQTSNRFLSLNQAETFLLGPVDKETGKRSGGYAASVPDMEFQIRRGQKSKDAGGGQFFFVESRPKVEAPAPAAETKPAKPAKPATAAPAASTASAAPTATAAPATATAAPTAPAIPKTSAAFWDAFAADTGGVKFDQLPDQTKAEWDEAVQEGLKPKILATLHRNLSAAAAPAPAATAVAPVVDTTTPAQPAATATPAATVQPTVVTPTAPAVTKPAETKPQTFDSKGFAVSSASEAFDQRGAYGGLDKSIDTYRDNVIDTLNEQGIQDRVEIDAALDAFDREVETLRAKEKPATVEQKLKDKQKQKKAAAAKPAETKPAATKPVESKPAATAPATDTAPKKETVETKLKKKAKEQKAKKAADVPETRKVSEAEMRETWEDNDPGDGTHVSWDKLPAQAKADWKQASEDGYSNTPEYDRISKTLRINERAERTQAKVEEGRKKAEDDTRFRTASKPTDGMTAQRVFDIVSKIIEGWKQAPRISVVDTDYELPAAIQATIDKQKARGKIKGVFHGGQVYIVAGTHNNAADVAITVAHEVTGHFGLRGILGAKTAKVMRDIYRGNKKVRDLADAMMKANPKMQQETAVEEVLAEMAEEGVSPENRSALRELFAVIRQWLRENLNVSFVTDNDVAALVANARNAVIEGSVSPNIGESALGTVFRVDTSTPAFKRWFGNSKAVDSKGKPLLLYHGTTRAFTVFDLKKALVDGNYGIGFYFSAKESLSKRFARGETGTVMSVYIKAENPAPEAVMERAQMETEHAWETWENMTPAERKADGLKKPSKTMTRDYLENLGYDSYKDRHGTWVVFRPEQIKSATDNNGDFDPANPDILMRSETPTFYSALEKAFQNPKIQLDKNGAAGAAQWKSWLASKSKDMGVKKEEIEWTGINEWLDLQQGKLTPQQIAAWVALNKPKVNDVLLSSFGRPDTTKIVVADKRDFTEDDVREWVRDRQDEMQDDPDTYEDALSLSPDDMDANELRAWIDEHSSWGTFTRQFQREQEYAQQGRIDKMTRPKHGEGSLVLPGGTHYAELVLTDPTVEPYKAYDDTHFGDVTQGKALGWLRMNERKDKDGNTVLFIEELQSQRGQDLRKGEVAKANRAKAAKLDEQFNALLEQSKTVERGPERDALIAKMEEIRAQYDQLREKDTQEFDNVPDAPFIRKTESWTGLLLKRAVAYAQSRGIDRIAWTTGEQQNVRYAFPGDQLVYVKHKNDDKIDLTVMRNGRDIRTVTVRQDQLSEYVGTQTANQITGNTNVLLDTDTETSGVLEGDDLKLSVANLTPYYNQTLPSVAKESLKSFGVQVEVMDIEGTGQQLGFVIPGGLQQQVEQDGLPLFRRADYESQFDDLPEGTRKIALAKGTPTPPTIRQRLEALKPDLGKRLVQGVFDRFRSVRDISDKAYMMLRLSTSVDGALEGLLHYGQVFNDDGALNIKKGTKGLIEIMQPLGHETERFLLWVATNRAAQLKKQDRELYFTDDEISKLQKLNLGKMQDGKSRTETYAQVLRGMNELNRSVLDISHKAGLIDDAGYKKFASDIWYVPFYRYMEGDGTLSAAMTSSGSVNQYFSRVLEGSERPLNDLLQNTMMNWSHILSASMKNSASKETLAAADQLGGIVSKITPISDVMGEDSKGNVVPLKGSVKVMEKGKPVHYQITDPFLLQSLSALTGIDHNDFFLRVAKPFKTTLTRLVALSPTFKVNNLIRDSIQSVGVSDLGYNAAKNVYDGFKRFEDNRAEVLAGGGIFTMGNAFDGDRSEAVKRLVSKGVSEADIIDTPEKAKRLARKLWDIYDNLSDAAENANRVALYTQMREKGATHLEASFAARDLQDFSSTGAWGAVRYANQIIPYLNSRLQGMYKLGKDGVDPAIKVLMGTANESDRVKARKFAVTTGAVTMTALALYLAFKDDEEFKKREDWDRDMFFWFRLPGMDTAIRIPKPFEMGAVATVAERVLEQMVDKDVEGRVFGQRMAALLADNFAINGVPQVIRPLYDVARNKDGLSDRPIETEAMKNLSADERINPRTSGVGIVLNKLNSMVADGIGKVTGLDPENMKLSPLQYDYMLRGYLGWLGTVIELNSYYALQAVKPGAMPDMKIDEVLLVGNFVRDLPSTQSKYVTQFYETAQRASRAGADLRNLAQQPGKQAEAERFYRANESALELEPAYNAVKRQLTDANNAIKQIQDDTQLSGAEKRRQIDELYAYRNEIAKQVELERIRRDKAR